MTPQYMAQLKQFQASTMVELSEIAAVYTAGIDVAELCGGLGRTSKVAIRRLLKTGKNFDLVTGCDLNQASEAAACCKYFRNNNVLVAVMAPTCGPFGP